MPDAVRVDVAILGAGFGGLCMGLRLLAEGHRDFLILEKAAEIGGTWRDNTYPGAACDVQSHLYSFSFAGNPDWSRRYAGWEEIQRYLLATVERSGLRSHLRLGEQVVSAEFDAASARWKLTTAGGATIDARHFVLASGPLHHPAIPRIPGLERFAGPVFHSARWGHSVDLAGRDVVSIGTGASAIQYCPEIAPRVGRLYVFQRTPAWVLPRDDRAYPARTRRRYARFPWLRRLHRARLYCSNELRVLPMLHPWIARLVQRLAARHVRSQVRDAGLARRLTPDYTPGCKRVLLSNDWYPMFARPNVELVTAGIREVREHSVVTTDGVERHADCIVLGTGFVVDPRVYLRELTIRGLPGHELRADWLHGSEAYYGTTVAGFPNLYMLLGPNSALGHNSVVFMIECQVDYALQCMRRLRERGADCADVSRDAQTRFNARLRRAMTGTVWSSGCQSWYQQDDGRNFTIWPWSTARYWLATRRVRTDDYCYRRTPVS